MIRFTGLALIFLVAGCATSSLGDPPPFEETLDIVCPPRSVKSCRVIGGDRWQNKYASCHCVSEW